MTLAAIENSKYKVTPSVHESIGALAKRGIVAAFIAEKGLNEAAIVLQEIPATENSKLPTASQSPTHIISANTVIDNVWKVFSRHNARTEPRLPATNAVVNVIRSARTT
jgi:hypothetical protein